MIEVGDTVRCGRYTFEVEARCQTGGRTEVAGYVKRRGEESKRLGWFWAQNCKVVKRVGVVHGKRSD